MTVGVAVVGCGLIGRKRVAALPDRAKLVASYDVVPAAAEALARDYGGHAARSADEAFEKCDLAIVATLHRDLPDLAARAVERGCHVLIEKPGARQASELEPVRDAAARRERVVRVGFNHRFHPAFLKIRELYDAEAHGRLLFIRARYGHGGRLGYEREWRADRDLSGGGELLDQGIHLIDLTRSIAGDATVAFAETTTAFWQMPVEDNAFVALRLEAGGLAWLHASWTEWKNLFSFEVAYERAKFEVAGLGGSYGTERCTLYAMTPDMGPPATTAWEWPQPDQSWERELDDVLRAIDGAGDVMGASIDDAIAALRIVGEAYRG